MSVFRIPILQLSKRIASVRLVVFLAIQLQGKKLPLQTNQFNGQPVLLRHFRKVFRDFIRIELRCMNLDGKFRKHSQCGSADDGR